MKNEIMMRLQSTEGNARMLTARHFLNSFLAAMIVLTIGVFGVAPAAQAQSAVSAAVQTTFASPDAALQALVAAAKDKDRTALEKLFGPDYDQLLSGDEVEDNKDLAEFASAVQESAQLQKVNDNKYTVTVGKDNWPTPVPVVQKDGSGCSIPKRASTKSLTGALAKMNCPLLQRAVPTLSPSGSTTPKAIGITTASPNMRTSSSVRQVPIMVCTGKRPRMTNPARSES